MSDHDSKDSLSLGKSDRSSDNPPFSMADSTTDLPPQSCHRKEPEQQDYESINTATDQYERYSSSMCFDVTPNNLSADQNIIRRGVLRDSNISGPAPKTGMPMMCGESTVETGPKNKGGELLEPPILTTPQRFNACSPLGSEVRLKGANKSTLRLRNIKH